MTTRPPSPPTLWAPYNAPEPYYLHAPPLPIRPRFSPSPLARSPPITQPLEDDDDTDTDDYPTDEEQFNRLYGKSLWSSFKDEIPILASDHTGPEPKAPKVQVTISLVLDREDDGYQGDANFEIILEVVSGPSWKTRSYSFLLRDSSNGNNAAINELRYCLPKIHDYLTQYGFSIKSGRGKTEWLVIHAGPTSHSEPPPVLPPPVLPLCFDALTPTDGEIQIGPEYSDYLLSRQKQNLASKWRKAEPQQNDTGATGTSQSGPPGPMTLRQRCAALDAKTLEYRQNVPRFKRKMEELNTERSADDEMPMRGLAPAPLVDQQA